MKKKIIKNKMTIEDLSERMDAGFKVVNSRIDDTNRNLHDRIDNLKDHMDQKFNEVNQRFQEVDRKLDGQTDEFSSQIQDVIELVENRLESRGILAVRKRPAR